MRKTSLVSANGKKQMCEQNIIILSQQQFDKLNDKRLASQIEAIAKDLHIDWDVNNKKEKSNNSDFVDVYILTCSRVTTQDIDDAYQHDLEMAADNFMSAVEKLQIDEPECPNHDNAAQVNSEKLAFVDSLIEDEQSIRKNFRGIDVMAPYKGMPFAESICSMTLDTWFEILKTYIVFHHGN